MGWEADSVFDVLQCCDLETYKKNAKIVIRDMFKPDYTVCNSTEERAALNAETIKIRTFYNALIDDAKSFNEVDRVKRNAIFAA